MQVCVQRHKVATEGQMFPSNSGSKPHKAYAWKEDAPEVHGAFCGCKGYIFGRNKVVKEEEARLGEKVDPHSVAFVCKHLAEIYETVCDWKQSSEADYQYNQRCPKCGGDVIDPDGDVIPDNVDDAVDDLRAMLAEINGEEAPAPIARAPQPKPFTVEFTMQVTYRGVVQAVDEDEAHEMYGDLYGDDDTIEVAAQCVEVKVTEGEPAPPKPKRVRKTIPTVVEKPDPKQTAKTAASLAATVAPRRRRSA